MKELYIILVLFVAAVICAGCTSPNDAQFDRIDDLEGRVIALQDYCERLAQPRDDIVWHDITATQTEFLRPGESEYRHTPGPRWKLLASGPRPADSVVELWRTYAREGPALEPTPTPTQVLPAVNPCDCDKLIKRPGSNITPLYWVRVKVVRADDGRLIHELQVNGSKDHPKVNEAELLDAATHLVQSAVSWSKPSDTPPVMVEMRPMEARR